MSDLRYTKPEPLRLKGHHDFSETWLHDRIAEDTGILGFGDVEVIQRERRQEGAGRLDLLLYDRDQERRYEVEIMLGTTDESHIIRCIEYWDIERRRFPAYDHCAVLVAEDITSRFLNILSLLAGNIPLVAIQLSALKVEDRVVLNFVRVLDQLALRQDDEAEEKTQPVDREYWNRRVSPTVLKLVDSQFEVVRKSDPKQRLKYNRSYIGLSDGVRSNNFVYFQPKKNFMYLLAKVSNKPAWVKRLEEADLEAGEGRRAVWVTLRPGEADQHRAILTEFIQEAVDVSKAE